MKRGTPDHPKLEDLAQRLEIPSPFAAGLLEFLWHWTAVYAPSGDVGRFTNVTIATKIRWPGDPDLLVRALVGSHWLDEAADPVQRLVVHDWPKHVDPVHHRTMARQRLYFADGTAPNLRKLSHDERAEAEAWYAANPTKIEKSGPPKVRPDGPTAGGSNGLPTRARAFPSHPGPGHPSPGQGIQEAEQNANSAAASRGESAGLRGPPPAAPPATEQPIGDALTLAGVGHAGVRTEEPEPQQLVPVRETARAIKELMSKRRRESNGTE